MESSHIRVRRRGFELPFVEQKKISNIKFCRSTHNNDTENCANDTAANDVTAVVFVVLETTDTDVSGQTNGYQLQHWAGHTKHWPVPTNSNLYVYLQIVVVLL